MKLAVAATSGPTDAAADIPDGMGCVVEGGCEAQGSSDQQA